MIWASMRENLTLLHANSKSADQPAPLSFTIWTEYSKTCVKRPLSKRPKIGFQDQLSLKAGQKYCRMLKGLPFDKDLCFVYFWAAVLHRFYCNIWSCYRLSFSNVASLCSWSDWFESYLVRNPKDRFSRVGDCRKFDQLTQVHINNRKTSKPHGTPIILRYTIKKN